MSGANPRPEGANNLLAWTVACCLAAGACGGPSRSAPPPRAEEAPSTLMPMDPQFSSALSSYASEVQRLEHLAGAIETSEMDDRIRRALRLLTVAVERIPRPEADDEVISLAVAQMHAAEVEGALLALPSDGVVIDPAERVLNAASTAFIHLARGPYLGDPRVLQASMRFSDAVDAIGATSRLRPDRTPVISALVEAAMVLREIGHASARAPAE